MPVRTLIAVLVALSALSSPSRALDGTLHSAQSLGAHRLAVGADLGFPYLTVTAAYGLPASVDLMVQARTGWGHLQRAGLGARWHFLGDESSAMALRVDLDTWLGRPDSLRWLEFTGLYDASASAAFLYSWRTGKGTLMTVETRVEAVGTSTAPLAPLGGVRPVLAFGPNVLLRAGAELPLTPELWLAFDLGLHLHLSGFDPAVALPAFSVGLAYTL